MCAENLLIDNRGTMAMIKALWRRKEKKMSEDDSKGKQWERGTARRTRKERNSYIHWQAVKAIAKSLPQFDIVATTTFLHMPHPKK